MRYAIISIVYNQFDLLIKQIQMYHKYCENDFEFIVIDTSNKKETSEGIKYHAHNQKCHYQKFSTSKGQPSLSHAFAANTAYDLFKDTYDFILWTDHDLFPIKKFSFEKMLNNKWICGLEQIRKGSNGSISYLWGGFIMINNIEINREYVDFFPATVDGVGLDTGGELHRVIKDYPDLVELIDEVHTENALIQDHHYKFYSLLMKGTFMHFINGSNWAKDKNHPQRINSLCNILKDYEDRSATDSNG